MIDLVHPHFEGPCGPWDVHVLIGGLSHSFGELCTAIRHGSEEVMEFTLAIANQGLLERCPVDIVSRRKELIANGGLDG